MAAVVMVFKTGARVSVTSWRFSTLAALVAKRASASSWPRPKFSQNRLKVGSLPIDSTT